ncbi:MAG: DUF523 domain-containing protein [Candidatus Aminicenantes bacterium]|nr:DUF523 domain-containing protein [Candidatus Aminicenantes bacterium]
MKKEPVILCSACLLGVSCRHDGKSKVYKKVLDLASKEVLIPVCPEQLGGLPTPRALSELNGDRVITEKGDDVTNNFNHGAREVLKLAEIYGCSEAIFKQRSPSCGSGKIYDGTFSGIVIEGDGVTAKLLKENGISVITEEDL